MYRLIFTAALIALVSACSVTTRTVDSSATPRTSSMGAPGYIGSGNWMDNYGGGPN